MADHDELPPFHAYVAPTLEALQRANGVLRNDDIERAVANLMKLTPEAAKRPHDPAYPGRSEVGYRVAWARTYLKKMGLIDNVTRGQWVVTAKGKDASVDGRSVYAEVGRELRKKGDEPEEVQASLGAGAPQELMAELAAARDELAASGGLLRPEEAAAARRRFRDRFGPEVLRRLEGRELLHEMHERNTKDSLVYWLEFKKDDTFPPKFGSIGGGSALKFGIYQSAESGAWMTGSPRSSTMLELEGAIQVATQQRDQLVAGADLLASYEAKKPEEVDFSALQAEMLERAPELAETSWGHKYFSLLFPALIPPIHGLPYQSYQLIKLLRVPEEYRYENDGQLVRFAAEASMSPLDLALVLHHRNGSPHAYYRVGTTSEQGSEWPRMRDGSFVAVGWTELGDLSALEPAAAGKARLRAMMEERFSARANVASKNANQLFRFVHEVTERDLIVVMEGATVLGIARPDGEYYFEDGDGPYGHRRRVTWLNLDTWKLPATEGQRSTFVRLGKNAENLIEVERRLLYPASGVSAVRTAGPGLVRSSWGPGRTLPILSPTVRRIQSVLQRKGQVILFGPPGTGKTFWAQRAAHELAARGWYRKTFDGLEPAEREAVQSQAVEICTFHPAYGYEDFLEGYRPAETDGRLTYVLRDGIFKGLCRRASANPRQPYYLLIDEINRGDIPRIFGELLTVLEKDKRGLAITLPLSGERWAIPANVHLIGTMNTADRSIALLDAALRRRFGFVELLPDSRALGQAAVKGLPLGSWLDALNALVMDHAGRDARNLQIGHAYLMAAGQPVSDAARLAEIVRDDIIPLLEEYCYEDYGALAKILGTTLVDTKRQRIHLDLFDADRQDELIEALTGLVPDITATKAAIEATMADVDEDEEASEEEEEDDGEET